MKQVREIVDVNGVTYREITAPADKTSWNQAGEFFSDLNDSLGHRLAPFNIRGGFQVSGSWILFGLIFAVDSSCSPGILACWLLSLFVRIR